MDIVKKNIRLINLGVAVVGIICMIFPFYGAGAFGITAATFSAFQMMFESGFIGIIAGILLLLAPAGILVYSFVLSGGKSQSQHAMILMVINVVGLVMIFIAKIIFASAASAELGSYASLLSINLAFGAILSLIVYAAGIVCNVLTYLNK